MPPLADVTLIGVHWNDPERVEKLLAYASAWFDHVVLGVQTDEPDPTADPTYQACACHAEKVVVDKVLGYCEPTIQKVLNEVHTPWALLIDGDQWPTTELLESLPEALAFAASGNYDALDLPMEVRIDGILFGNFGSLADRERRLFRTHLGWPASMHDRPHALNPIPWTRGVIHHDRSLDEMMRDYIGFFRLGRAHEGTTAHNRYMMRGSCENVAAVKGWEYVQSFPWWPEIRRIGWGGEIREYWDDLAERLGAPRATGLWADKDALLGLRELLAGSGFSLTGRVLDIGCGTGRLAELVEGEYVGVDISPRMVEFAQSLGRNAILIDAPANLYAFDPFDRICVLSVFTHVPRAVRQEYLAVIAHLLVSGGEALVDIFAGPEGGTIAFSTALPENFMADVDAVGLELLTVYAQDVDGTGLHTYYRLR